MCFFSYIKLKIAKKSYLSTLNKSLILKKVNKIYTIDFNLLSIIYLQFLKDNI